MAIKLCTPVIGGMVSNLSTAVFVSNCVPGATVFIRSLTRPGTGLVKARSGGSDGFLPLLPGEVLKAGDLLVVSQDNNAGAASPETDAKLAVLVGQAPTSSADIPPVDIAGRLWECGLHSFVGHASPGLTVEILRNGTVIGSAIAQDGVARINLTKRYVKWELVKLRQRSGGAIGPELTRQVEPLPLPPGSPLPPPVISSEVRACQTAIRIDGVFEGADVTVTRKSGETETAGFDLAGLWFNLSKPLSEANGWVKVSQAMTGCERQGQDVTRNVAPPKKPDTPIVYPLCAGMVSVTIDNVEKGAEVHITAGGDEFITTASGTGFNRFDIAPLKQGTITVQVFACGLASDAVVAPVDAAPAQIDAPAIVGDLVKCQRTIPLDGLKPGAIVQIWSKGPQLDARPISAQVTANAKRMDVAVTTLLEDAEVWAVQWACSLVRRDSPAKRVNPAPAVDDPFFADTVTRLDTRIRVKGTIRDAQVEVLRRRPQEETWLIIGQTTAPGTVTNVALFTPIAVNDELQVRQRYCAVQSPGSRRTTVLKPVPLQPVILSPAAGASIAVGTAVNLSWKDVASGADADRMAESYDVTVTRGGTQVLSLSQAGTAASLPASATAGFGAQFQLTVTPRNTTGSGLAASVSFKTPKAPDPVIAAAQDGEKIKVTGTNFAASHAVEIEIVTDYSALIGAPPGSPGTVQVVDNRRGKTDVISNASGAIDVSLIAANVLEPRQELSGPPYKAKPFPGATVTVTARNKPPISASQGSANLSNAVSFTWST